MEGYLEVILGPMFSGKTTYLINKYNDYMKQNKRVTVINFSDDTRYHDEMLSSHDKIMIPCVFSRTIGELLNNEDVKNSDIVLINEGQFFEDLYDSVIYLIEKLNKRVYVCGLDGDFKRKKFGRILDVISICDKATKLHSKCYTCESPAIFSHRISSETSQVVIGTNNYVPLCRKCYLCKNSA